MKRICIISDTQLPYHDRKALAAVVRYIGDAQPDEVIHIGDLMDYPTPARWSKGSAEEFAQQMKRDNVLGWDLFDSIRKVYDGPIGVHEGNHDLRPRQYLTKYAPALAEFEGQFHIESMLDFDGFGVTLLPEFYKAAPGWITTHGHRGGISLSRIGGNTALGAARKFNASVAMGHTHRLGVLSESYGFGSVVGKSITGLEVGNLMNMKAASYLKGGTGNWQQGFGLLTVDGKHVKPEIVPILNGKFMVDGFTWEVK